MLWVPDEAMGAFMQLPPVEGLGAKATYKDFKDQLLRHQSNFIKHPQFWGFVVGMRIPSGMLSDMLTSGLNVNMVGGSLASTMLELQVIN